MQTMRRRYAGLTPSRYNGAPIARVQWELLDEEQLRYEPWTSRSRWHTIGTVDELQLAAVGIANDDEHTERLAAEDQMWDEESAALDISGAEIAELFQRRKDAFIAWLTFAAAVVDRKVALKAVTRLNLVYWASRAICEARGDNHYIHLTKVQYRVVRMALWAKVNPP